MPDVKEYGEYKPFEYHLTVTAKTNLTRADKCMIYGMTTKREIRMALRRAEKLRREARKYGDTTRKPWLLMGCVSVMSGKAQPF